MENIINQILLKEIKPKLSTDIILTELFEKEISIANKLEIIQMRLGKIYEELAKLNSWTVVIGQLNSPPTVGNLTIRCKYYKKTTFTVYSIAFHT